MNQLMKFGACAGIVGGGLRLAAIAIPFTPENVWLETLYAVIDLGFLFGLIAIYLRDAEATGRTGLIAFIIALSGIASIVGPDAQMFGINFYLAGSAVFLTGLALLAASMLRYGSAQLAAIFWIASFVTGLIAAMNLLPAAFIIAGATLACGFIVSGISVLKKSNLSDIRLSELTPRLPPPNPTKL